MAANSVLRCFRSISFHPAALRKCTSRHLLEGWQRASWINYRCLSATTRLASDERRYTQSHEWTSLSGNIATVGITDYAQDKLGEVVYVELPEVGDELSQGDVFGAVESVKAASDLYSPVGGTVESINESLSENPEMINKSPTDEGWMMKLKVSDVKEFEGLMSESDYKQFIEDS